MNERIKENFPLPRNDLLEGNTSLDDTQPLSAIIDADVAILDSGPTTEPIPVITEPERRFTAPSIGGGGDVLDRSQAEQDKILSDDERADVGMINTRAVHARLAEIAAKQAAGRVGRPMHVDGRIPGQVPSTDAKPSIPAGAKPSRINEIVPERNPRNR